MNKIKANRVLIVGGGITGLSAAYQLEQHSKQSGVPLEVTLLESSNRIGGVVQSLHHGENEANLSKYVIETGADSFITSKPWALDLCRELNLDDQLIETQPHNRRTFVVRNGKLIQIPTGFVLLAPSRFWPIARSRILSWSGKLRLAMDLLLPRRKCETDESVASFVTRRMGRETLDRIVQPLLGGIYTANPEHLSIRATMPQFVDWEKQHRSLIQAVRKHQNQRASDSSGARFDLFVTPRGGMADLIHETAKRLGNNCIQTNKKVIQIAPSEKNSWKIDCQDPVYYETDAVILAVPSVHAAPLVKSFDDSLSNQLHAIPYASTAIAILQYHRDQIGKHISGFGILIPKTEGLSILGCSFLSEKFSARGPKDHIIIRVFIGGALQPELLAQDDHDLCQLAHKEVSSLLEITQKPIWSTLYRHHESMPQYTIGHQSRVQNIEEHMTKWRGLELAGNAYHGIGIPDCIHSGREAAKRTLNYLQARSNETNHIQQA
mgnify:FL=1